MRGQALPFSVLFGVVILFPLVFRTDYAIGAGITVASFAIGTVGFVLLLGLAHQLAIGQAAFYMIGGYGSAILTSRYGWDGATASIASALLAVGLAYLVGWPLLKLRGFVLAIASLALHLLFISLAILFVGITGGSSGIPVVPHFSIGHWSIESDIGYYALAWALVAVMTAIGLNIDRSYVGRALRAVAADEAGAAASGINTAHYKLQIFVVSAGMASIGGSILTHYLRVIDPTVFGLQFSLDIITAVIIGGLLSVWGGVLGAGAIVAIRELLQIVGRPDWEVVIMGALTVVVLLGFRAGLVGAISTAGARLGIKPRRGDFGVGNISDPQDHAAETEMPDDTAPILRVRGISRHFGNLQAVSDVTFDVRSHEIVALIGPNGAGKTTTLDMISGHRGLHGGSIWFRDVDLSRAMPDRIARAGIARTFQAIRLFDNMTVLENVMCGAHVYAHGNIVATGLGLPGSRANDRAMAGRASAALDFVGLGAAAGKKPRELPFGHQRMMELARALALSPQLMLLDEPASGLNDTETEELAKLLIRIRARGITILIVEHDIRLVMGLADRIVVLDHGEKIAEGTPHTVRNDTQVITAYLGLAA